MRALGCSSALVAGHKETAMTDAFLSCPLWSPLSFQYTVAAYAHDYGLAAHQERWTPLRKSAGNVVPL